MLRTLIATVTVLSMAASSLAQETAEPTLKVGDPAPKLSIEKWVKGRPVEKFEKNQVYVVEFWATWCGPCIRQIPHLTQLQRKHRRNGLTVIGVAASEREADESDRLKKVTDFVRSQGAKMDYTVAFDADRSMSRDWMRPANQRGIPAAFLVDKSGKIAYIGFPNERLDEAVEKALREPRVSSASDLGEWARMWEVAFVKVAEQAPGFVTEFSRRISETAEVADEARATVETELAAAGPA